MKNSCLIQTKSELAFLYLTTLLWIKLLQLYHELYNLFLFLWVKNYVV